MLDGMFLGIVLHARIFPMLPSTRLRGDEAKRVVIKREERKTIDQYFL